MLLLQRGGGGSMLWSKKGGEGDDLLFWLARIMPERRAVGSGIV